MSSDIFRRYIDVIEEAQKPGVTAGLNEFAQTGGGDSGDYLKSLASAWYYDTFETGSLQKGIKSQKDVERLLARGIVCPDGKVRKYEIGYNNNFDGVNIYSDDYYEHGDESGKLDSRTGKPFGPYEFISFSDDDLDDDVDESQQGMAEGEKNPHTSALGKALYRDLSKEKKASPAQVKRNQERWAQRQKAKAEQPPTKGMSNAEKVDKGWRNPNIDEGVAEGTGNIGRAIKSLYRKIYRAGDDEIEYFYNDSPIFAQYWDEYEGDLDSIIAEVDPAELAVIKAELESYAEDAGLTEGETTRTPTGLIHRATDKYGAGDEPFNPHNPGKYVRDLDSVNKQQVKDLDTSMGINWKSHGPKGIEVDEVSDATLTSYLTKVDADSQKHEKDPTKRSPEKRNKSVAGFARAFNKLDARKEPVNEIDPNNYDSDEDYYRDLEAGRYQGVPKKPYNPDWDDDDEEFMQKWYEKHGLKEGKTFKDYVAEAEYMAENPVTGDYFAINVREDTLLETWICEETQDGIVLHADDTMMNLLEGYGWLESEEMDEAKYQGREVPLGKPMAGDVKKSKVYVKGPKGNVVKVNFGDPDMKIKKSNPARRKSFRARHNCENPGPRWKARYWSCRAW